MFGWLKFNIIEKMPFMVYLEIQCITFKMEKSFIAHPWIQRSVVGLEEYSAHDWRAATSGTARPSYLARVGPVAHTLPYMTEGCESEVSLVLQTLRQPAHWPHSRETCSGFLYTIGEILFQWEVKAGDGFVVSVWEDEDDGEVTHQGRGYLCCRITKDQRHVLCSRLVFYSE